MGTYTYAFASLQALRLSPAPQPLESQSRHFKARWSYQEAPATHFLTLFLAATFPPTLTSHRYRPCACHLLLTLWSHSRTSTRIASSARKHQSHFSQHPFLLPPSPHSAACHFRPRTRRRPLTSKDCSCSSAWLDSSAIAAAQVICYYFTTDVTRLLLLHAIHVLQALFLSPPHLLESQLQPPRRWRGWAVSWRGSGAGAARWRAAGGQLGVGASGSRAAKAAGATAAGAVWQVGAAEVAGG